MVADLTGLEIANASLLDEATAAAEAMHLALRRAQGRVGAHAFFVAADCHPQTIDVVQHARAAARRSRSSSAIRATFDFDGAGATSSARSCSTRRPTASCATSAAFCERAHAAGALVAVAADLLALVLLEPPGEFGRRHRGRQQRSASACRSATAARTRRSSRRREAYKRSLPGRLVGVSRDAHGKPALRLALQTREQHIRREKATSNICTAQVLLAVIAGMYAVYHGPEGTARDRRARARDDRGARGGAARAPGAPAAAGAVLRHAARRPARPRDAEAGPRRGRRAEDQPARPSADGRGRRRDRARRDDDASRTSPTSSTVLTGARARPRGGRRSSRGRARPPDFGALARTQRVSSTHPVFNTHHSETEMLRYLAHARVARPVADDVDDPARLVHDEAERDGGDVADHVAGLRAHPSVRAARADEGLPAALPRPRGAGSRRSPASPRARCSRTPARRASTPACS